MTHLPAQTPVNVNNTPTNVSTYAPPVAMPLAPTAVFGASPLGSAPSGSLIPRGLTVLGLLHCVRRRWKTGVLLGGIAGFIAAVGVWLFLPPAKPYVYLTLHFQGVNTDQRDLPVRQQTQRELIRSRVVIKQAVTQPEIAQLELIKSKGDPVAWLIRNLTVDFPMDSEIMTIKLADDHLDDCSKVLDAIATAYMDKIDRSANEAKTRQSKLLAEQQAKVKGDLEKQFGPNATSMIGVRSSEMIAGDRKVVSDQLSISQSELRKLSFDLEKYKKEESRLNERLAANPLVPTKAEIEPYLNQNQTIAKLRADRDEWDTVLTSKSIGLGPNNPEIISLKNRISEIDARILSLQKQLTNTLSTGFEDRLRSELVKVQDDLFRLEKEEKVRKEEIDLSKKRLAELNEEGLKAASRNPELAARADQAQKILGQYMTWENGRAVSFNISRIEEEPVRIAVDDASRRTKMAGMGGIAFFGLMFSLVGLWEFRARRIGSPNEVQNDLGLKIVGTVPARPNTKGFTDVEWDAALNEAVDSARTVFLHTVHQQRLRTVMVSSATGSEGKTSLSVRLAASLARTGRKILLIDADLRSPAIHGYYRIDDRPGVAEVLRQEVSATDAIKRLGSSQLYVLTAGRCDSAALGYLGVDGFKRVLDQLKDQFEMILIDSSPILPVADAMLIGRHVDGVLMSLMVDHSQADKVTAACQKLASLEIPLLGAVVNGTRGETYGYARSFDNTAVLA